MQKQTVTSLHNSLWLHWYCSSASSATVFQAIRPTFRSTRDEVGCIDLKKKRVEIYHLQPRLCSELTSNRSGKFSRQFVRSNLSMSEQVAVGHAPDALDPSAFDRDHQIYFTKSADKVNSTLHAATCKSCQAHNVELKDGRTCLWQGRDCIRHLARCPHVSEAVRSYFKEEARLLNARLNSKKRPFQETLPKPEGLSHENLEGSHVASLAAGLISVASDAAGRFNSLSGRF